MSGTGNYYYKWTKVNGGTLPPTFTSSLENAELGIYQVEITDGCSKKTLIFELKDCNANPLEIVGTIRQNCETFKYGKIDISILKGSGDYDITWNTGEKTATIEKLYANLYTVKVIDKNTGCSLSSKFNVTDNRPIEECLVTEPGTPPKELIYPVQSLEINNKAIHSIISSN